MSLCCFNIMCKYSISYIYRYVVPCRFHLKPSFIYIICSVGSYVIQIVSNVLYCLHVVLYVGACEIVILAYSSSIFIHFHSRHSSFSKRSIKIVCLCVVSSSYVNIVFHIFTGALFDSNAAR